MDKFAQRRSLLNKLREKTNVSGIAAEKFFNPEFQRVMEVLRETDDHIRSIATGTSIEGQDPGSDPISLKDLFKQAKSNFNKKEYITSVNFLGRFHQKIEDIVNIIKKLNFNVDQVHHDFLFKDLDDEQRQHLEAINKKFSNTTYAFAKEAGIVDFLTHLTSTRGRALAAWEKRYPNQVKKFKNDTKKLLDKTEVMLRVILTGLSDMASARATRKLDDYISSANKISANFNNYNTSFAELYGANIKEFVNNFLSNQKNNAERTTVPNKAVTNPEEMADQEIDVEYDPTPVVENKPINTNVEEALMSSTPIPPLDIPKPTSPVQDVYEKIKTPGENEALQAPKIPKELRREQENRPTIPDVNPPNKDEELTPKSSHERFFNSLQTLGDESPILLASYIRRYAKSIESFDPETSIQLLSIANKIGK